MWITVVIIFHALGIISSINAVMTARTSQGAIAWVISLNTFPYATVPAYWILGRSRFRGYVVARRSDDEIIMQKLARLLERLQPYRIPDAELTSVRMAAEKLADLPILSGNSVELLVDGDRTFDSILQGIDTAQDYILFQFSGNMLRHIGQSAKCFHWAEYIGFR